MFIEITTFRLTNGVDEAPFLEADKRVQTEFIPNLPGFMRRTTARGSNGEWVVIVLWGSEQDAEDASRAAEAHPATAELDELIDQETVQLNRYRALG